MEKTSIRRESPAALLPPAGAWLALVAAWAVADFVMFPMFAATSGPPSWGEATLCFAVVGCTLAQGTTLAAWLAWSAESFLRRLTVHWGIAAALYSAWAAGVKLSVSFGEFAEAGPQIVALAVPLVSIAAQLPLWIVRHFYGWRIVRDETEASAARDASLTIRDLLLATLIIAGAFGLARLMPSFFVQSEFNGFWLLWAIAFSVASVISTIAMLPAGAFLLRMRRIQLGLLLSGLYAALLVTILWSVVAILWWWAPALLPPLFVCVGLSSLMLSFAATLIVAAMVARAQGYRLVWGRCSVDAVLEA